MKAIQFNNKADRKQYKDDVNEFMTALNIECFHDAKHLFELYKIRKQMNKTPDEMPKIYFWSTRNKIGYIIN